MGNEVEDDAKSDNENVMPIAGISFQSKTGALPIANRTCPWHSGVTLRHAGRAVWVVRRHTQFPVTNPNA